VREEDCEPQVSPILTELRESVSSRIEPVKIAVAGANDAIGGDHKRYAGLVKK
jgi:hypothetical protein